MSMYAKRDWAAEKARKKFKPRDMAQPRIEPQPAPASVVRFSRPPLPRPADAHTIATAEIAHRLRFPRLYGLSFEQADEIRNDIDGAIAKHALTIRPRKGRRV